MNAPGKKVNVSAEGESSILITRTFDAPPELVFDAHTECKLIKRWLLGPDGWSMPVCEVDLRVGGKYRYVWKREATGHEMKMGGEYREIERPEKLVATEKFDDPWYEGEAVSTITLMETSGKTYFRNMITYQSREIRDSVLKSPMEEGVARSYDRLEELLAEKV
jgi:uncharacterized protein YndB with AHSA1/START domain